MRWPNSAEQVAKLRQELAAGRTAQHCHGCSHVHCNWGHCGCFTMHYYSTSGAAGGALLPYTVTTNAAAGAPAALPISN